MAHGYQNYIGGEWVPAASGQTFDDLNPADRDDLIGRFPRSDARDVDRAVQAAQEGFARWARVPAPRRAEVVRKAGETLRRRKDELGRLMTREMGKVLTEALGDVQEGIDTAEYMFGEGRRLFGVQAPCELPQKFGVAIRVPVGVVAAITPFNAPLNTVIHKVAPAIAAGNAVVLKPAEQTPLCSVALAAILLDAGLPPGFLQVTCGPGETTGAALVADRRVRFFTFTGSAAVGLTIKQNSGIAKSHLELGSNSASIVAADADLELVADLVTRAGYRKAGQVCTSVQRLLAHASVIDELTGLLAKRVAALRAGDPRAPGVQVGPLIAPAEAERAQGWITEAVERGATAVTGGERDGPVLIPTLLRDPPPDSRIMTEEIFAPAVALVAVGGLGEAIDVINAGEYGLQAGVFTRDLETAFHAARRLRVGGVMINDTSSYHADAMPYGGVKNSGFGLEGPRYAIQDMTDPRIIVLNLREGG